MTSLERTVSFIKGDNVDRPPFHPIVMRFAAKYAGVAYGDFCCKADEKVKSLVKTADDFGMDWVTTLSDPYIEAADFGLPVDFPHDELPMHREHLIKEIEYINKMKVPNWDKCERMKNRVREVELYRKEVGGKYFILGWIEGMFAEYVDLRGLSDACLDLYDNEKMVRLAFDILLENAKRFAKKQVEAGADCIGIGDAATSQIGEELFSQYCHKYQCELVEYIHSLGCMTKIHICGNTSSVQKYIIATGTDIIDVDHTVTNMKECAPLLKPNQVFSGQTDPVGIIQDGSKEDIEKSVRTCFHESGGRTITSAGCEITPGTDFDKFRMYADAASALK